MLRTYRVACGLVLCLGGVASGWAQPVVSIRDTIGTSGITEEGATIDNTDEWHSAGVIVRSVPVGGRLSQVEFLVTGFGRPDLGSPPLSQASDFMAFNYELVVWHDLNGSPGSFGDDPQGLAADVYGFANPASDPRFSIAPYTAIPWRQGTLDVFRLGLDVSSLGIAVAPGEDLVLALRQFSTNGNSVHMPFRQTGGPVDAYADPLIISIFPRPPYLIDVLGYPRHQYGASVSVLVPEPSTVAMLMCGALALAKVALCRTIPRRS